MAIRREVYVAAVAAFALSWVFVNLYFLDSSVYTENVKSLVMKRRAAQVVLVGSTVATALGQDILDLSQVGWTLTSPNYSNISVPGKIPSQAHLDLFAASVGLIPLSILVVNSYLLCTDY